jgi:hypothetical protein
MELTVSNSNQHALHPVWAKALGVPTPSSSVLPSKPANASVTAPQATDGWQVIAAVSPRPGAPVAVKKQLGPHLWISTTVRPGDPRYPSALQV